MGDGRGIPFWPLYQLMAAARRGGGPAAAHWRQLAGQVAASLLLEPLRLIEVHGWAGAVRAQPLRPDPIFVLGHFRSGTTFLQELLAQDPRFGHLNLYRMVFFDVARMTERAVKPVLAMLAHRLGAVYHVHRMPVDFDMPGEDDFALLRMGAPEAAYWGGAFPRHYAAFFDPWLVLDDPAGAAAQAWMRRYAGLVRKLGLLAGGRRLVLKSPPHTGRIPVLRALFPDARFVYIHRDPYAVFGSSKWLWDVNTRYGLQDLTPAARQALILDLYRRLVAAYLAQRGAIPAGRLVELRYEDLVARPVAALERVYDGLGLDGFDAVRPAAAGLAARRRQAAPPRHDLTAEEIAAIQREWAFSLAAWPYPAPGPA